MRIVASVILVLVLLVLANFVQALAVGIAFGAERWSDMQVAADLSTRWVAFALAAFIGASVARDRAALVAVVAGAGALAFGVVFMASSSATPQLHDYLSLAVLVTAPVVGALSWKAFRSSRETVA